MADHNEAMRLADALDKWARDYATTYCTDDMATKAAALLRQQAERIAELQSAHAIAVEIAAQYAAERDRLREEVERLRADGERYRKLRQQHEEADSGLTLCVFRPVNDSTLEPVGSMPGELDAEIDAARTTHKETE